MLVSETERMAREAGLTDIRLNPKKDYVAAMTDWNDPLYQKDRGAPAGRERAGGLHHQPGSDGERSRHRE